MRELAPSILIFNVNESSSILILCYKFRLSFSRVLDLQAYWRLGFMMRGVHTNLHHQKPSCMLSTTFCFVFMLALFIGMVFSKEIKTPFDRKLLQSPDDGDTNRIGTSCSKEDIVIYQGSTSPLPNGIPSYAVEILNVNVSGCEISNIHVTCGWFSSARLVNPRVFRRIYYDDCLVNDGQPLHPGQSLSFQYANSFSYPLSVSSVACC